MTITTEHPETNEMITAALSFEPAEPGFAFANDGWSEPHDENLEVLSVYSVDGERRIDLTPELEDHLLSVVADRRKRGLL